MPFGHAARFEAPIDFEEKYKTDVLEAKYFGHACMQVGGMANETYGSEDCLFANIWRPANAPVDAKLPVLCFIYGGSWQFGEPEPYNGSALASQHGIIYASIAYRTGPIGFMAFETDVAQGETTGNWGMLDMQSGLRWLKREVGYFGGDPERITIHGQSSGGQAVELHYVMPASKGLLQGIISESGGLGARDMQTSLNSTQHLAAAIGCDQDDPHQLKLCVQKIPAINITGLTYNFSFGPVVDKVTIIEDPFLSLSTGRINRVAVIMGAQTNDSNKELLKDYEDEFGILLPLTARAFKQHVAQEVNATFVDEVLALYPATEGIPFIGSVKNVHTLGSIQTDRMLCGARRRLSLVNKVMPGKAWMYRFNYWYQSNPNCTAEANYHPAWQGAIHEDETTFVMGQPIFMFDGSCCGVYGDHTTAEGCPPKDECTSCYAPQLFGDDGYHAYFNEKEFAFSQTVGRFWTNFVSSQNPNRRTDKGFNTSGMTWPAAPTDGGNLTSNIVLDGNIAGPTQFAQTEHTLYDNPAICNLWDRVEAAKTLM